MEKFGPLVRQNVEANGYRFEWEYAAKANQDFQFAGSDDYKEVCWYRLNASTTQSVGLKKPNGFGLYDMSGNVSEWCWDKFGEEYYKESPLKDPVRPSKGTPGKQIDLREEEAVVIFEQMSMRDSLTVLPFATEPLDSVSSRPFCKESVTGHVQKNVEGRRSVTSHENA